MSPSPASYLALWYREATIADVAAMEQARATDAEAGPPDARMAAYLAGRHHPRNALAPRAAFVAIDDKADSSVVAYIAGHATTRYGCAGEVQYLYVAPKYRRHGVGSELLQCVARWFRTHDIKQVCVNADIESAGAVPFYAAHGARPLSAHWYVWDDIRSILSPEPSADHRGPAR